MTTRMSFTSQFTFIKMAISTLTALQETGITAARAMERESKCPLVYYTSMINIYEIHVLTIVARNVNIPWPHQGMGDGDYMFAFHQVVMPIATEFDPDLVIGRWPMFRI